MIAAPRIPEVLHVYWDGSSMSFLQYLTLKSFLKHNIGWRIKLYLPTIRNSQHTWASFEQKDPYRGKNYFDRVFDLDIEIMTIDFEDVGFRNDIPEVIKSDYLRYKILGAEGGYWCDFDVLFFKSIQCIYDSEEPFQVLGDARDVDTILCPVIEHGVLKYYTIGFLASSPGNPFFLDLAESCLKHLDLNNYQSIGVNMIKNIFPNTGQIKSKYGVDINLLVLPHEVYLPLEYNQTKIIFEEGSANVFPEYTVGIHWFNGHPDAKEFQNKLGIPARSISEKGKIFQYMRPYLEPIKMHDIWSKGMTRKSTVTQTFEETYESNLWGDQESKSGSGSRLSSTSKLRQELQELLSDLEVETIVDLACGDFNWMRFIDFTNKKYTGIDIVDAMISSHIARFSSENISFKTADLISDPIEKYDLIILRDVLVHLTMEDVFYVLKNIVESGSKYLLTTSFTGDRRNIDLQYSAEQWRTLSLHQDPFNFPPPIRVINEGCQEGNGLFTDKSLVLLEISELATCLAGFEVSPLWFSSP